MTRMTRYQRHNQKPQIEERQNI